jgi:hypothetical protein
MRSKFFDPVPGDWPRPCAARPARHLTFVDPSSKGVWRGGEVLEVEDSMPMRDPMSNQLAFWPGSSELKTSLVVVLATPEYDSSGSDDDDDDDNDDDGTRRLYIPKARLYTDAGQPILHTMYRAFIEAMKDAGKPEELPEIGGYLFAKWFDIEPSTAHKVRRKLWKMQYRPPGTEEAS